MWTEPLDAAAPKRRGSARPPPLPRPPPPVPDPRAAGGRSGTHPKINREQGEREAQSRANGAVAPPPSAPGHRLRESVVAGRRPDPRAEPTGTDWMDDATTLKVRVGR